MRNEINHQHITNNFGMAIPFNRSTLIALTLGMTVAPNAVAQINFTLPRTIFDSNQSIDDYVVADFDGDGLVDLAVTNFKATTVYHQDENGAFTFLSEVDQGDFGKLIAYDMDNDGDQDLVWSVTEGGQYNSIIKVALNQDGSGVVWQLIRVDLGNSMNLFTVGDIDGDGDTDIIYVVTENCYEAGYDKFRCDKTTYVLKNTGNGFKPPRILFTRFSDKFHIRDMQVGDIDHDGDLDIVDLYVDGKSYIDYAHNYYKVYGSHIDIFKNDGNGNFFTKGNVSELPYGGKAHKAPRALKAADFDGDGDLDIAVVVGNTDFDEPDIPAEYLIAVNNGIDERFLTTDAVPFGHGDAFGIEVGDLDSDGRIDLIFTTNNDIGVFIFPNKNGNRFGKRSIFPANHTSIFKTVVHDMNQDGMLDILSWNKPFSTINLNTNITQLDNPVLETTPLIRGEQTQIIVSGLEPSEEVYIGMTSHGWANTVGVPFFGGITFDLADVGLGVSTVTADEMGIATLDFTVPQNAPLGPVLMQGAIHRGSNGQQSVKTIFVESFIEE